VSSYSQKENVFKALELGALDFVVKPAQQIAPDAVEVREQILAKVLLVRSLRPSFGPPPSMRRPAGAWTPGGPPSRPAPFDSSPAPPVVTAPYLAPKHVIAIASSTGGPSALLELFGKIPKTTTAGS